MEQTKPLTRTPATGVAQTTQPATAQTQPAGKQAQPVSEKKSRWWLWLIIALAVIGAGIAVYLWVVPLFSS